MLLRVHDLRVQFASEAGAVRAVDGVSFDLAAGRTLALVGESGCGKSLTALSILRLLPPAGQIVTGRIELDGQDLGRLSLREMQALRGNRIAMVFQEPMTSLNPLMTIGAQIDEVLRLHRRLGSRAARAIAVELLRGVGIPAAPERAQDYPHQLSGGMRQRVMIAMALACEPELLIADEPTTALDVTVQAQVLALLAEIQRQRGLALLLIAHDLGVVGRVADDVAVMYAGRIVEHGPAAAVFQTPQHPYTQGLLRSTPRLVADGRVREAQVHLPVIPGEVPNPARRPAGCAFHPRCALAGDDLRCRTITPALLLVSPAQACACWKAPGYLGLSEPRT